MNNMCLIVANAITPIGSLVFINKSWWKSLKYNKTSVLFLVLTADACSYNYNLMSSHGDSPVTQSVSCLLVRRTAGNEKNVAMHLIRLCDRAFNRKTGSLLPFKILMM